MRTVYMRNSAWRNCPRLACLNNAQLSALSMLGRMATFALGMNFVNLSGIAKSGLSVGLG